jgi:hypothetical protein
MPAGPPKRLEAFVGLWIPPACREEVLGDLHEKYTGPWQYIALALCVIPFVILSRIRRTTDILVLLTEALLIYGSFLAWAWYTDRTVLASQWGPLRLAIPTALNLVVLIVERVWNLRTRWWHRRLVNAALFSIGFAFNNFPGECLSMLLVPAIEFLSRPGTDMPQSAAGPALWLKQRTGPAALSEITKGLLAATAVVTLSAIAMAAFGPSRGWLVPWVVLTAGWFVFGKSGKE